MGKMRMGKDSVTPVTRQVALTAPEPTIVEKFTDVPVEVIVYKDREVRVEVLVEVIKEVVVEKIVNVEVINEVIVEKQVIVPEIKYVDKEVEITKIVKVHDIEPVLRAQEINRKLGRTNALLKMALVALTLICIGIGVSRG